MKMQAKEETIQREKSLRRWHEKGVLELGAHSYAAGCEERRNTGEGVDSRSPCLIVFIFITVQTRL